MTSDGRRSTMIIVEEKNASTTIQRQYNTFHSPSLCCPPPLAKKYKVSYSSWERRTVAAATTTTTTRKTKIKEKKASKATSTPAPVVSESNAPQQEAGVVAATNLPTETSSPPATTAAAEHRSSPASKVVQDSVAASTTETTGPPAAIDNVNHQDPDSKSSPPTIEDQDLPTYQPKSSTAVLRSKLEPGQVVIIRNLKNRADLNERCAKVQKILPDGRIAVEVPCYLGKETVSIKEENLEIKLKFCDAELETCPICFDTAMDPVTARSFKCCGQLVCFKCLDEMQTKTVSPFNRRCPFCPFCNSKLAKSEAELVAQLRSRADRGNSDAMYDLALQHHFGRLGLPKDEAKARMWYKKAAVKNHPLAANNLAGFYFRGIGGPENLEEAVRWLHVSSDLGCADATITLVEIYLKGIGIDRDLIGAKQLLKKSINAGNEIAKELYHKISWITPGMMPMMQQYIDYVFDDLHGSKN